MPAHLHSRILPLSLLLALSQAGCVHLNSLPPLATVQPAQPALLIENARIFSGDADQAVSAGQDVLIEAGRIKAIGAHPLNVDASERIDARGKLLLPGLIDMHVHVGFTEAPPWYPTLGNPKRTLSAYAAHGVTTVLMGNCSLSVACGEPADLANIFQRVQSQCAWLQQSCKRCRREAQTHVHRRTQRCQDAQRC